jgi:hypothetical protein
MSGFKVFSNRKDLDAVFTTRTASDPSSQVVVPFVTPAGQNLSDRYLPYIDGEQKASATGFKCFDNSGNMVDLSDLYSKAPTKWNPLGLGTSGIVRTVYALDASNVYVGGSFTTVRNADGTSITCNNIAKWDGSSWSALGSGQKGVYKPTNPSVYSIYAYNTSNIYVGGDFTQAGGVSCNYIAKWNSDTGSWSAFAGQPNGTVRSIHAIDLTNIYVGGDFTQVNSIAANTYIAKWNGTSWSSLGSSVGSAVRAIYVYNNTNVYVGGQFTSAGGNGLRQWVARWDGTNWQSMASSIGGNYVYAINAVDPSKVYIGGNFSSFNGITGTLRIAKYNGSNWAGLAGGMNSTVFSLGRVKNSTEVYAGGVFTTSGGVSSNYIAKWSDVNSSWSVLGDVNANGVGNGTTTTGVNAIYALDASHVYVGGDFTTVAGESCNYIAMYNDTV